MVSKTILVADDALQLSWLREAWRIAHTDGQIALESCMTDKLIEEHKKAYGQNVNGELGKTEQAYMITSLLMNPEAQVLKYFTSSSERNWPFPKYLGACGRVIFVENGWKLLDTSLASPWKERANIALQLLNMIDTFRNEDPEWIVIFLDFRYENFAVDQYGRLNLIDFDEVMLIDRKESGDGEKKESCNMKDLKRFLSGTEKDGICFQVPQYSQMMYALACVRLLSFLSEHLLKSLSDRHRSPEHVRPPGLLWGPPEHEATAIEALLRGCVEEKVAGGRLEAVGKLKAVLRRTLVY
ncbi:C3orf58 [Branchiostoma lanceolatum]|nr:C3orf58 [Branchiostoma lanceolatum]